MKNSKVKKVLLINFGGIGDEILFFPTIKSVKDTYPHAKIFLALEPRSKTAGKLCQYIDDVICVDIKSKFKYLNILKFLFKVWTMRFDIVFSSGSSNLVSILLFLTGIKERYGYKSGKFSEKLLTATAVLNKNQYAANMYHDLIKIVNNDAICELPTFPDFPKLKIETSKPIILIHPGVSLMSIKKNIIKAWSEKNWAETISKLLDTKKYTVILAGGKDDKETIFNVVNILNANRSDFSDFINFYGQTKNITDLIGLIKTSDIMICVDSAPLHMAVATNTSVVALFGPTNEKVLLPQKDNIRVLNVQNLKCRPCLWDKRQVSCDEKKCLDIKVEDVLMAIEGMLVK